LLAKFVADKQIDVCLSGGHPGKLQSGFLRDYIINSLFCNKIFNKGMLKFNDVKCAIFEGLHFCVCQPLEVGG
jgi:hypothetical protein